MPRPAFCIIETLPVLCPSRDGVIGERRRLVEYCETESWGHFRAGELTIEAGQGSDASYNVARTEDPHRRTIHQFRPIPVATDDEIPF
jgi:hypothetical protein